MESGIVFDTGGFNMDDAKDTVVFTDDNGDEFELEIVDYFLYNGDEYVILADMGGVPAEPDGETVDVFIMKVDVIDDETEEFSMISPESEDEVLSYAYKLLNGELPNEDEIL